MSTTLNCAQTNQARIRLADLGVSGRAFQITQFVSGEGGHDPAIVTQELTPQVEATVLPLLTFGPKAITSISNPSSYVTQVQVDFTGSEAVGVLSNIGLMAQITYSPIPGDPLVGTTFLFGIGNMPMQNKLAGESRTYILLINY